MRECGAGEGETGATIGAHGESARAPLTIEGELVANATGAVSAFAIGCELRQSGVTAVTSVSTIISGNASEATPISV